MKALIVLVLSLVGCHEAGCGERMWPPWRSHGGEYLVNHCVCEGATGSWDWDKDGIWLVCHVNPKPDCCNSFVCWGECAK